MPCGGISRRQILATDRPDTLTTPPQGKRTWLAFLLLGVVVVVTVWLFATNAADPDDLPDTRTVEEGPALDP